MPHAVDNVGVAAETEPVGLVSGAALPIGTHLVHYSATDHSGNTGHCNFTVTVTQTCKFAGADGLRTGSGKGSNP